MTIAADTQTSAAEPRPAPWRRWGLFVLIGLTLYIALYAWSEYLVYAYADKNRFFMVRAAPPQHYDFVILGASHAMPLGFADMNGKLETASGGKIINLSTEGSGILPNRLLLDYLLTRHSADNVVFVLDSFAFYQRQWNEDRLDTAMLQRAPLDPALVATLWRYPWARPLLPGYVSGFAKINNADRFAPDVPDAEANKFTRTYRPIAQIDRQRIQFLYPATIDPVLFQRYLGEFESLVKFVQDHGMEMIVVKLPTPPRYRDKLPEEPAFDAAVGPLMTRLGVAYEDFSEAVTDNPFFYDTDHLNRDGVVKLIDEHLGAFLHGHL